MLGNRSKTPDSHMERIKDILRTTFQALPKNKEGKLEHAAVRYTLHKYFVQRHAWYVRGLSDVGEGFKAAEGGTLQDQVEDFVQGVFEQSVGAHGLDLGEMALLVATFENLVHQETMQRLSETFTVLQHNTSEEMNVSQVDEVLDAFMLSYILRIQYSKSPPKALDMIKAAVYEIYPTWGETKQFLRDVRARSSFHKSSYSNVDVEELVEQIGDEYGRWQDKECRILKQKLLALEDRSIGTNGSGRVRIADFYGSALNGGNWQFVESREYLAKLGLLDFRDPSIPRVIIPNYVNSPSNCLAGSKYYSVCCINECEELLDSLEHRFQTPAVAPQDLLDAVSSLPSSTVPAGRELHPILVARLDEIAKHHGGQVPLHGRLFAQWMHHAYPRECPYPHLSGTVRSHSTSLRETATVKSTDMSAIVAKHEAEHAESAADSSDECTAWSNHEELYVGGSGFEVHDSASGSGGLLQRLRPVVYFATLASVAGVFARQAASGSQDRGKAGVGSAGKDFFV